MTELEQLAQFGIAVAVLLWVITDLRQQRDYYQRLLERYMRPVNDDDKQGS